MVFAGLRSFGQASVRFMIVWHRYRRKEFSIASKRLLDTYDLNADTCGPMVFDAMIVIKNETDPTLTFRAGFNPTHRVNLSNMRLGRRSFARSSAAASRSSGTFELRDRVTARRDPLSCCYYPPQ
jgi:hypothetical protein